MSATAVSFNRILFSNIVGVAKETPGVRASQTIRQRVFVFHPGKKQLTRGTGWQRKLYT